MLWLRLECARSVNGRVMRDVASMHLLAVPASTGKAHRVSVSKPVHWWKTWTAQERTMESVIPGAFDRAVLASHAHGPLAEPRERKLTDAFASSCPGCRGNRAPISNPNGWLLKARAPATSVSLGLLGTLVVRGAGTRLELLQLTYLVCPDTTSTAAWLRA